MLRFPLFSPVSCKGGKILTGVKSRMKKIRGCKYSACPHIRGNRFINFSFNSLSFVINKNNSEKKKWIAVCGGPLYGGLNALLHIAVIFITHRRRNVVIFHIYISLLKVFKEDYCCRFFQTVFCLCTHNVPLLYY